MQNHEHFNNLSEVDQKRVMQAVNELCRDNAAIAEQLTKLADLKINKPFTFKLAIKKLNS